MKKFLDDVASVLDVETVTPDMRFRDVDGWCSLMAFGLLVMMENDYGVALTIEEFMRLETVEDLYRLVAR